MLVLSKVDIISIFLKAIANSPCTLGLLVQVLNVLYSSNSNGGLHDLKGKKCCSYVTYFDFC